MGLGGISLWQLLIVLAIVALLFGTRRLRTMGSDLGSAVRGFRKAMDDGEKQPQITDEGESATAPPEKTTETTESR